MAATAIDKINALCGKCGTKTDLACGNDYFVSHKLNKEQSTAVRRLQVLASDAFNSRAFRVVDGSLHGKVIVRTELDEPTVKGRSNGVLSYLDCARDPQGFSGRREERTVSTEMLYIHRDICARQQIGSDRVGTGRYFSENSTLEDISQNRGLLNELLVVDSRAMIKAWDGHALMGNWQGANGATDVLDTANKYYGHRFPNLDGAAKQILLQKDNCYFSTVLVTLPEAGATGAYFLELNCKLYGEYATIAELLTAINMMCDDVTGDRYYSATLEGTDKIKIVSNRPTYAAYGPSALEIRFSEAGEYSRCGDVIACEVVQGYMPFEQTPFCKDYSTPITKENWEDYWVEVLCDLQLHCLNNDRNDSWTDDRDWIVMIDPRLAVFMNFSRLQVLCEKENAELYLNELGSMMPRFVPTRALLGTGGWVATTRFNFEIHTNTMDQVGRIKTWYDDDCKTVKSDNEMIMGIFVNNFCNTATNLVDSAFHKAVKDAPVHEPLNLPHLQPKVQMNSCNPESLCTPTTVLQASGSVCVDDSNDPCVLKFDNTSASSASDPIDPTQTAWVIKFIDGSEAPVVDAGDSVSVELTAAEKEMIAFIEITVTTVGGDTSTNVIPTSKFETL